MSGNKVCSVILGAPDGSIDKSLLTDFIICADRGLDHALAAGILPDIAVGDFDSSREALPEGIECIRVSPIKDDTDAALAADTAIERGYTEIRFFCALGGRFDHTFANVQLLQHLHGRGITAALYGGAEKVRLLHSGETAEIPKFDGYVSVFAFTDRAVVTESGMKYGLSEYELKSSFPLGVSNEVSEEIGRITVHRGTVILCEYMGE